jgi:hypothetical protein
MFFKKKKKLYFLRKKSRKKKDSGRAWLSGECLPGTRPWAQSLHCKKKRRKM